MMSPLLYAGGRDAGGGRPEEEGEQTCSDYQDTTVVCCPVTKATPNRLLSVAGT